MYVGADGCPDGWIAVEYDGDGYVGAALHADVEALWSAHGESAETILLDVPIGLREASGEPRPCDDAARDMLDGGRSASVFPVPVRDAVHAEEYEDAKAMQERLTDRSLGVQSWNIADGIGRVDTFLRETEPAARGVIREAHPEVCFQALAGGDATDYSKTGAPAAAFWERVTTLEGVDPTVLAHLRDAGSKRDANVGLDDVVDAVALALTASPLTGPLRTLPEEPPPGDDGDPTGLPMEMVYARRST
jgi:predicted RNase H-like nuclease